MAVVYKHIRKDTNEVFYIGIGKSEKRAYNATKRNQYWKRIIEKYSYDIEIIETDLTWEAACEIEKQLIKKYGRADLGLGSLVNMTDGGDGTKNMLLTNEYLTKLRKPKSEEFRLKCIGRTHSEETKQKMSEAKLGKKRPVEVMENIVNKRKLNGTYSVSNETKKKLSIAGMGRTHSEITKEKISKSNKKFGKLE